MTNSVRLLTATLILALAPIHAIADDMSGMDMGGAGSPADKAFARSMQTMMKDMGVKPTGHPDKDFVTMMIPHHQGRHRHGQGRAPIRQGPACCGRSPPASSRPRRPRSPR